MPVNSVQSWKFATKTKSFNKTDQIQSLEVYTPYIFLLYGPLNSYPSYEEIYKEYSKCIRILGGPFSPSSLLVKTQRGCFNLVPSVSFSFDLLGSLFVHTPYSSTVSPTLLVTLKILSSVSRYRLQVTVLFAWEGRILSSLDAITIIPWIRQLIDSNHFLLF